MNFNMFLPGLEEVLVTKMEKVEVRICFHVEMPIFTQTCPNCKKRTRKVQDYRAQQIKHLKMFERLTFIFIVNADMCVLVGRNCGNAFIQRYQRFSMKCNQAVNVRCV